jgi:hypothetical protein
MASTMTRWDAWASKRGHDRLTRENGPGWTRGEAETDNGDGPTSRPAKRRPRSSWSSERAVWEAINAGKGVAHLAAEKAATCPPNLHTRSKETKHNREAVTNARSSFSLWANGQTGASQQTWKSKEFLGGPSTFPRRHSPRPFDTMAPSVFVDAVGRPMVAAERGFHLGLPFHRQKRPRK